MVGIVIVTHGNLARELLETAKGVVGEVHQVETLAITVNVDVDLIRNNLEQTIQKVDSGDGVLILTDMFGGTPSNISLSFLNEKKVEVLTGVNLPMLIKLLSMQDKDDLYALSKEIEIYGKNNIYLASEILKNRSKKKG
ncbi:PTS sugar transporter subunit IIA [Thermodesulfobacteriota bacterium]